LAKTETEQPRRRRLKGLSFNKMIPNILTLLAVAAGLTSMRFALHERWELAVFAIVIAAILDALDGRVARLLKGASKFGAELDSLSDFVCFGVAPAMILYLWAMQNAGRPGWILVMLFAMCMGLRLARFNVALDDEDAPAWKAHFFTGVPAPAGAGLVLLPMVLSFQWAPEFFRDPWVVSFFLFVVGGLTVSAVPTFSFKRLKVTNRWILPTMLIVAGLAAFAVSVPWMTLSAILILYILTFPFSIQAHRRFQRRSSGPDDGPEAEPQA